MHWLMNLPELFAAFGTALVAIAARLVGRGKYIPAGIVARDLQRVAETGVADSMWDMIVCTFGALATIPAALRLCQGRHGLLSGMVHDFIVLNFGSAVD